MKGATLNITRARGLVAVFSLLTGLLLVASAAPSAFAASPHLAATSSTSSCSSCHSVHSAAVTDSRAVGGAILTSTVSVSCLSCHDGSNAETSNVATGTTDSFGQNSGHSIGAGRSGDVDITGCETCHYAHGASSDARRIPAGRINGVEVSSAGNELCFACHTNSTDWYGADYPSTTAPTRNAIGYPVAGTWTGPVTYASTSNAHRLIPESTQTVGVSEPIRREKGSCVYCHGAHGGANEYDGLVSNYSVPSESTLASDTTDGTYAELCFTCHGGQNPGFATTPVDIKRFVTGDFGNAGHSIVTSGGTLPVGAPLPCFECHNPHGSARQNSSLLSDERGGSLATTSAAGVRELCFTCHTTGDSAMGWESETATYTTVPATEKIVGLSRQGGALRLSAAVTAHTQADGTSCYDCHGDSYATGGTNVHNPSQGEVAPFGSNLASIADGGTPPGVTLDSTLTVEASASIAASMSAIVTGTPLIEQLLPALTPLATPDESETASSSIPPPSSTESTTASSSALPTYTVGEP